jgi:hypothetical protein
VIVNMHGRTTIKIFPYYYFEVIVMYCWMSACYLALVSDSFMVIRSLYPGKGAPSTN